MMLRVESEPFRISFRDYAFSWLLLHGARFKEGTPDSASHSRISPSIKRAICSHADVARMQEKEPPPRLPQRERVTFISARLLSFVYRFYHSFCPDRILPPPTVFLPPTPLCPSPRSHSPKLHALKVHRGKLEETPSRHAYFSSSSLISVKYLFLPYTYYVLHF